MYPLNVPAKFEVHSWTVPEIIAIEVLAVMLTRTWPSRPGPRTDLWNSNSMTMSNRFIYFNSNDSELKNPQVRLSDSLDVRWLLTKQSLLSLVTHYIWETPMFHVTCRSFLAFFALCGRMIIPLLEKIHDQWSLFNIQIQGLYQGVEGQVLGPGLAP